LEEALLLTPQPSPLQLWFANPPALEIALQNSLYVVSGTLVISHNMSLIVLAKNIIGPSVTQKWYSLHRVQNLLEYVGLVLANLVPHQIINVTDRAVKESL
jgi:hypothetical protein